MLSLMSRMIPHSVLLSVSLFCWLVLQSKTQADEIMQPEPIPPTQEQAQILNQSISQALETIKHPLTDWFDLAFIPRARRTHH